MVFLAILSSPYAAGLLEREVDVIGTWGYYSRVQSFAWRGVMKDSQAIEDGLWESGASHHIKISWHTLVHGHHGRVGLANMNVKRCVISLDHIGALGFDQQQAVPFNPEIQCVLWSYIWNPQAVRFPCQWYNANTHGNIMSHYHASQVIQE